MKKTLFLFLLCVCMLLSAAASASNYYIIPDSDTRELTDYELREFQYEVLGYAYNEIFARHGYHFKEGGKYAEYFASQDWYAPSEEYDDNDDILAQLSRLEFSNANRIRKIQEEMRSAGDTNPDGKPLDPSVYEPEIPGMFSSFVKIDLPRNLKLRVFSGPSEGYYRSANGKAMASTNGDIYACGWEDGWLMMSHWINEDKARIGFVPRSEIKSDVDLPDLEFAYETAVVTAACALTEDPFSTKAALAELAENDEVVYLAAFSNEESWAYVETYIKNEPVRGFIPHACLSVPSAADE